MNFEPTQDQSSVLSALDSLLQPFEASPVEPVPYAYAGALAETLAESGFGDIAGVDGFGPLDAALVVERVARVPQVVEIAATALIAGALGLPADPRPLALASGSALNAARFLPMARRLVVLHDSHADLVTPADGAVEPVESLLAYPYGHLRTLEGARIERFEDAELVRRRWRIGIAAEAAGCMAAALAVVVDHVKSRFAFGRPLGSLQAIQHRLAMAAETAESARWLALRAAWADSDADAAIAAGFAQSRIAGFTYDLHQFSGAMGLTLEFPLHFWTYRLRALAGELGGAGAQARAAAAAVWGDTAGSRAA
ncbi:acyl-CoA dehydrogenase [Sandaracinobacter sp. RS1-74]|uniref:acyl-CoA dehydrogenase family protein n=1 Tax=Sandaracinobacteroides sayramensis TaxID=2913411 RepID=UPI001EDB5D06|nr:acyl-CoA dehydrogenase family protein [Sandaracinobacteroides sayramensis]MCG2842027.1 acyl-CoA dehydrogenase [Sandaracinobacteroides sayramensis]